MVSVFPFGTEDEINRHAIWVSQRQLNRILDVGGSYCPLRCATHVIDRLPYETRNVLEGRGPLPEKFNSETWALHDVSETWPYTNGYFDYVWCSQLMEDLRDPIFVCREMMRVGKAGFVSTIHRSFESGAVQDNGLVGYHHHRWLVEAGDYGVEFTVKSPLIYVHPEARPKVKAWLLNFTWEGCFPVWEQFINAEGLHLSDLMEYKVREDE